MLRLWKTLFLLVSVVSFAACDSGTDLFSLDVSELSHDPDELVGTWDLVSFTSAGMVGEPVTTSPTRSESYRFEADGSAEITRDGVSKPTVYTVESSSLRIEGGREFFGIDGDRLYFDARPMDGSLREFARR